MVNIWSVSDLLCAPIIFCRALRTSRWYRPVWVPPLRAGWENEALLRYEWGGGWRERLCRWKWQSHERLTNIFFGQGGLWGWVFGGDEQAHSQALCLLCEEVLHLSGTWDRSERLIFKLNIMNMEEACAGKGSRYYILTGVVHTNLLALHNLFLGDGRPPAQGSRRHQGLPTTWLSKGKNCRCYRPHGATDRTQGWVEGWP